MVHSVNDQNFFDLSNFGGWTSIHVDLSKSMRSNPGVITNQLLIASYNLQHNSLDKQELAPTFCSAFKSWVCKEFCFQPFTLSFY
jgi:hypothetical protein